LTPALREYVSGEQVCDLLDKVSSLIVSSVEVQTMENSSDPEDPAGRGTGDGARLPLSGDVLAFFFACVSGLEERFLLGMGGNGPSF
jgi:hypothetical protein